MDNTEMELDDDFEIHREYFDSSDNELLLVYRKVDQMWLVCRGQPNGVGTEHEIALSASFSIAARAYTEILGRILDDENYGPSPVNEVLH